MIENDILNHFCDMKWRNPDCKTLITEFNYEIAEELGDEWIKSRRIEYLNSRKADIEVRIAELNAIWDEYTNNNMPYWEKYIRIAISDFEDLKKERIKIMGNMKFLGSAKKGDITALDIQAAREIPLSNFLEVNKGGFAKCPFHDDKSPSFKVYPIGGHCFGCGENASDTIDFIMKRDRVGFVEAVKKLKEE